MINTTIITFDIKFSNVDFAKNCGVTLMIHQLLTIIVYDANTVMVKTVHLQRDFSDLNHFTVHLQIEKFYMCDIPDINKEKK